MTKLCKCNQCGLEVKPEQDYSSGHNMRSSENRQRVRELFRGQNRTPEHAAKIAAAHMGKKASEDTKRKMREAHATRNMIGSNHPSWKGGRMKARRYIKALVRGHPYADKNGYVFEHRLVMEKQIKRYLLPGEVVHHINGIKTDNRIENLRLMMLGEHTRLECTIDMSERRCSICGGSYTGIQYCNGQRRHWNNGNKGFECDSCWQKRYRAINRQENREEINRYNREYSLQWRAKNKEKIRVRNQQYWLRKKASRGTLDAFLKA
jgi:hypothetical protein